MILEHFLQNLSGNNGGPASHPSIMDTCVCQPLQLRVLNAGGVTVDFLVTPMKLWKSTGWKFGRKLPYLHFQLLTTLSTPLVCFMVFHVVLPQKQVSHRSSATADRFQLSCIRERPTADERHNF